MPESPTAPEIHEIALPGADRRCRLTRVRLGDVAPGTLITRRSLHQFADELAGADAYDLVMGLALRSTRSLDPLLGDSQVWQVEILTGGA